MDLNLLAEVSGQGSSFVEGLKEAFKNPEIKEVIVGTFKNTKEAISQGGGVREILASILCASVILLVTVIACFIGHTVKMQRDEKKRDDEMLEVLKDNGDKSHEKPKG